MMFKKSIVYFFMLFIVGGTIPLSGKSQPVGGSLKVLPEIHVSSTEWEIYQQINKYRTERGLRVIPLSESLTYVAQMHVRDLAENNPVNGRCNLHSWSDKGNWSPCCYTEDQRRAECMWKKPGELTNYTDNGYEIAYWTNEPMDPKAFAAKALRIWKGSPGHNSVIINIRQWKRLEWKAVGVGYYKGYMVVWFGAEQDDYGEIQSIEK
jgi:hypothetical protein